MVTTCSTWDTSWDVYPRKSCQNLICFCEGKPTGYPTGMQGFFYHRLYRNLILIPNKVQVPRTSPNAAVFWERLLDVLTPGAMIAVAEISMGPIDSQQQVVLNHRAFQAHCNSRFWATYQRPNGMLLAVPTNVCLWNQIPILSSFESLLWHDSASWLGGAPIQYPLDPSSILQ